MWLSELTKQTGEQRNQNRTDQGDAATGHELLHTLGLSTGVIVAITFQEVDCTPDTEAGTKSDDEGLKDRNSLIEKCHNVLLPELDHVT